MNNNNGNEEFVVLLGTRAWTSLWGIVWIVAGSWRADRIWDDIVDDEAEPVVTDIATAASEILDSAYEHMDATYRAVTNTNSADFKRIHKLFRGPMGVSLSIAGMGWFFLAVSFLMDCHQLSGWYFSPIAFLSVLVVILLATTQTVFFSLAMHERSVHEHSHFFTFTSFFGYVALGVLVMLDRNDAPFWLSMVGAGASTVAPNLLWFCRKRGDIYDRAAVLNPRPVLYNVGGPLLVAGWIMFWVAMNCVVAGNNGMVMHPSLPVYWTSRTAVAFEGALVILAAYWASGYAQDEHDIVGDKSSSSAVNDRSVRPLNSFPLGRELEMRLAFVVAYLMTAVAAFLPTFSGHHFWSVLLFLTIVAQGFAVGVQHVLGIRANDKQKLFKWTRVSVVLYALICIFIFLASGFAAGMLALTGSLFMGAGWMLLQTDRKRGEHWMETGQLNPNWTVYSYGVLLFPLGLILFSWGLSIA